MNNYTGAEYRFCADDLQGRLSSHVRIVNAIPVPPKLLQSLALWADSIHIVFHDGQDIVPRVQMIEGGLAGELSAYYLIGSDQKRRKFVEENLSRFNNSWDLNPGDTILFFGFESILENLGFTGGLGQLIKPWAEHFQRKEVNTYILMLGPDKIELLKI